MSKVVISNHPLVKHKTALLRGVDTTVKDFRDLTTEITKLVGYEATADLPTKEVTVTTPLQDMQAEMLDGLDVAIVPILRAGLGMVDGMLDLLPTAKVGHVGMYRDHDTHQPVEYYFNLPADIDQRRVFVLDPMLATGGSASAAVDFIKSKGGKNIALICLVSAPEGIEFMQKAHPDVDIFSAVLDEKLNDTAYILPGLGDAGDRLYGT
jgi:uracil phosphoribosyltransferase